METQISLINQIKIDDYLASNENDLMLFRVTAIDFKTLQIKVSSFSKKDGRRLVDFNSFYPITLFRELNDEEKKIISSWD